jgi:hypothetical protein
MKKLIKMETDYNDVVPRREYLTLEALHKEAAEKYQNIEKEFKTCREENK